MSFKFLGRLNAAIGGSLKFIIVKNWQILSENAVIKVLKDGVIFCDKQNPAIVSSRPRGAVDRASGSKKLGVRTPLWDVGAGLSDETV
jgi:hypothetical protein